VRAQGRDDVEELGLGDRAGSQVGLATDAADVLDVGQIDAEHLLEDGGGVVAKALAVALVDQELVIVDGDDVSRSGT
jgi:hypothetical protein